MRLALAAHGEPALGRRYVLPVRVSFPANTVYHFQPCDGIQRGRLAIRLSNQSVVIHGRQKAI